MAGWRGGSTVSGGRALRGQGGAAPLRNAAFEVLAGEAHQPFQESPTEFNTRVDAFWLGVDDDRRR